MNRKEAIIIAAGGILTIAATQLVSPVIDQLTIFTSESGQRVSGSSSPNNPFMQQNADIRSGDRPTSDPLSRQAILWEEFHK